MKSIRNELKAFLLCVAASAAVTSGAAALSTPVLAAGEDYLAQLEAAAAIDYEENTPISREAFCAAIARTLLAPNAADAAVLPFEDTDDINSAYLSDIRTLYQTGVLQGSKDGGKLYLHPTDTITRQDAISLLGRMLDVSSAAPLNFTDSAQIAPYAAEYISWFVAQGILSGYPDGEFKPHNLITTNEAAIFIMKSAEHLAKNPVLQDNTAVLPDGMNTLAGTGSRGHNDGAADTARFTLPYGVITDGNGAIVVLDTYNNLIRRVKNGETETISGVISGWDEYQLPRGGYLDIETKDSEYNHPTDGDYNSKGELFIADSENHVVRFERGGKIYTFSGSTQGYQDGNREEARFNTPSGIAIDESDNVYIADTLNHCIRKINAKGVVTTIAGKAGSSGYADGRASDALFHSPAGIAVSPDGSTVYVADTGNHRIRAISNNEVTTLAGGTTEMDDNGMPVGDFRDGPGNQALFYLPRGIDYASGTVFVADSGNNRVRAILPSGNVITLAGADDPGDGKDGAALNSPCGVEYHRGVLYVADTYNNKIKAFPLDVDSLK